MSSSNKKHVHKYYKSYLHGNSGDFLWTCALPTCQHHMPKHYEHTLKNKMSACWGNSVDCENVVVLDERAWRMDKPLCQGCDANFISTEDPDLVAKLLKAGLVKEGE